MANSEVKTIGVDMDEVLYPFSDEIFLYYHEKEGSIRHFNGRGVGYRYHHAWGMSEDKVIERVERFFDTDHHHSVEPLDGSVEGIKKLAAEGLSLTIVTARQHMAYQQTADWVEKHFRGLFDDIITCNHYSSDGVEPITKAEALKKINGDLLIDDSPGHVKSVIAEGRRGILFGDYSWNYGDHGVERAGDWADLLTKIIGENG